MAKAHLTLEKGYKTKIQVRDITFYADEPESKGGTNTGPTPMEMLMASLGACAAITARMYAERKGWPLEGVEIDLSMERYKAADYPSYKGDADGVNEFLQRITFKGNLTDEQRARLLEIAGRCPVHKVLSQPNFMFEQLYDPEATVEAAEVPPLV